MSHEQNVEVVPCQAPGPREKPRHNRTACSSSLDVYAKGSYPNFTNVVRDSDVDIAAELTGPAAVCEGRRDHSSTGALP